MLSLNIVACIVPEKSRTLSYLEKTENLVNIGKNKSNEPKSKPHTATTHRSNVHQVRRSNAFLLLRIFSIAISVSTHVSFKLVLILVLCL